MKAKLPAFRLTAFSLLSLALLGGCMPEDRWNPDWRNGNIQDDTRAFDEARANALKPEADKDFPLPADKGPLKLSIEETIIIALKRNRDLAVQQTNPIIAGAYEQIERGRFDPEFFATIEQLREKGLETARSTGTQFEAESKDNSIIAGIKKELPSGTTVEGSIEHIRNTSNRTQENQEARVGLTITQSLLNDFGAAVNLARVRQAKLEGLASEFELRRFTEALMAEVEIAYWKYAQAEEEIGIVNKSLEVARQQETEISKQIDVGALAETEKAAVSAEVARRNQDVIDAQSALEASRLKLLRLLNLNPGTQSEPRILELTSAPEFKANPIEDSEERLKVAEKMRPDLNEAKIRISQNRLETVVTKNGLLPRLDLFVSVGITGFSDTFGKSFREIDGSTYDVLAGLDFSRALGNREAEARHKIAQSSLWRSKQAMENLKELIQMDVRLAINEVERARKQIEASKTTRELQEKSHEAEKKKLTAGTGTSLQVAQAQRELLAAQISENQAVIDYRIALVHLYLSEGSLLERRGISLGSTAFGDN